MVKESETQKNEQDVELVELVKLVDLVGMGEPVPRTGYYYFGARYYDSDLSGLFLSVDPMSDKYPSISPYAYCAWNPAY